MLWSVLMYPSTRGMVEGPSLIHLFFFFSEEKKKELPPSNLPCLGRGEEENAGSVAVPSRAE